MSTAELRSRKGVPVAIPSSAAVDRTADWDNATTTTTTVAAAEAAVDTAVVLQPANKSYRLNVQTGELEERGRYNGGEGVWMSDDEGEDGIDGCDLDNSDADMWNDATTTEQGSAPAPMSPPPRDCYQAKGGRWLIGFSLIFLVINVVLLALSPRDSGDHHTPQRRPTVDDYDYAFGDFDEDYTAAGGVVGSAGGSKLRAVLSSVATMFRRVGLVDVFRSDSVLPLLLPTLIPAFIAAAYWNWLSFTFFRHS